MAKKINVKLILELRGNGMGRNAIARTKHISVNSVNDVFHKADENSISYEDIRDMDEDSVYRMFYPDKFVQKSMYARPDYGYVHQELKRAGVTLKLLWQEYQDQCRAAGSIPMGYTKYCKGYSDYCLLQNRPPDVHGDDSPHYGKPHTISDPHCRSSCAWSAWHVWSKELSGQMSPVGSFCSHLLFPRLRGY